MNYGWNQDVHLWLNRTTETLPVIKSKSVRYPSKTFSVMDAGKHRMNWQYAQLDNSKIEKYSYVPGFSNNMKRVDKFVGQKSLRDATEGRHIRKTVNSGHVDGHVATYRADELAVKGHNTVSVDNNCFYWRPDKDSAAIKFN